MSNHIQNSNQSDYNIIERVDQLINAKLDEDMVSKCFYNFN